MSIYSGSLSETLLPKVVVLLGCIVIYFLGWAIYNIYLSPLSRYPGPFLAKISGIPSFYHAWKGDRHIWLWQCQQRYGSTFRYSPTGIIINTAAGLRAIYDFRANTCKGRYYSVYTRRAGAFNTLTCIDKAHHARKRRVLSPAFSDKAMRSAEPYIVQHIDRWAELLIQDAGDDWSGPINISDRINYLVFDILGELCFGRSFNTKEPGTESGLKRVPHLMSTFAKINHPIGFSPFVDLWLWLKPRGLDAVFTTMAPPAMKEYSSFVFSCLRSRIESNKHEQGGDGRRDMLHYILAADSSYTQDELYSETNILILAGTDTTSTVISAALFYLVHNQDVYKKLTDEIRSTFPQLDDIQVGAKLTSCRYLAAVINETLRMNPPSPGELSREVLPGGLRIDSDGRSGQDSLLPEGTSVGTSLYALHHDPELFPHPFVFAPHRWLGEGENSKATETEVESKNKIEPTSYTDATNSIIPALSPKAHAAFAPFSIGPRNCVGRRLADLEMTLTLARLLHRLDVRRLPGDWMGAGGPHLSWGRRDRGQFQVNDAFISLRDGPLVQFRERKDRV